MMQMDYINKIIVGSFSGVLCVRETRDIMAHLVHNIAEHEICNYVSGRTTLHLVMFLGVGAQHYTLFC